MVKVKDGNRVLCTNCERMIDVERIFKKETFNVRGEPIEVEVEYTKCKECCDEVLNPAINPDPFVLAYRRYRLKHSLLQPEEINDWRKKHHLSQGELAKLTGIGIATLNRYENGALQNEAHERLLRLTMDSTNLYKLIEKSEGIFSLSKKIKLLDALKQSGDAFCSFNETIKIQFGSADVNILNGYKKLDLTKLSNLILFYSKSGVLKSKLNKLLFYTDFKYFKESTLSITGLRYAHLPYGPVPDNYSVYYAAMASDGLIEINEEIIPPGYYGEIIKALKEPDLNLFSPSELRIIVSVMEDFKEYTAKQIQDLSHNEKAYQQTKNAEIIPYSFARELNY
jgi:putative zinc finger/helix-turn-helix YgiT family protein